MTTNNNLDQLGARIYGRDDAAEANTRGARVYGHSDDVDAQAVAPRRGTPGNRRGRIRRP